MDPRALEERTQAIGAELFAGAKRHHAHLSATNRWTSQVLSWCLGDQAVKGAVLRFIDVLPSLASPREIARHVHEYFPTSGGRLPAALRVGAGMARSGLLTHGSLAAIVRQLTEQVARQFIAESTPEGAVRAIDALAQQGAACSLDILGEQVLSEPEANRYAEQCARLLEAASAAYGRLPDARQPRACGPRVNVSIKPSALTPRFDPISPSESIERAARRLLPLCDQAARRGGLITLDMEQYELRDLTLGLAERLLLHPEHHHASLGVVVQAYLKDAEASTDALLQWLLTHERSLTVRLVKGAYWDHEIAQAAQCGWPSPVYEQKAHSDAAFERLTRRLLGAHPLVTTAIGSHNVRSVAHAMAAAELQGLSQDQIEFQLLYGMGDALAAAIHERGYPVRIYTPVGELIPGMAYLVRRILENTANESFLKQEFLQERDAQQLLRAPEAAVPAASSGSGTVWANEPLTPFHATAACQGMAQASARVAERFGAHHPLRIGGAEAPAAEPLSVRNPAAPNRVIGTVGRARVPDVARAMEIAAGAQECWAATPVAERVRLLRHAAGLMRQQRHDLAAWEAAEVGKTWREADADVAEAIDYLDYYGACMLELAAGKPLRQAPGERNAYVYQPRGVAVVIAPWNFPAAILTGMAAAALAAGNAVVMKPAEQSSIIGMQVAGLLQAAGIPPDVVQCLPGLGSEVGAALVQHPAARVILFTGSKAVGLSILEACGKVARGQRFVKHAVVEMGGKNAIIVDADADLDAAVSGVVRSAFGYAGQKCSAASRLIVHEAVWERLMPRLIAAADSLVVGDPADPRTDVGPLIEASAQQRLREAAAHAAQVGTVLYQYPASRVPREGYFVGPVIASGMPPDDRLAREELFGPLVCAFRVKTFENALALANDSDYALTGGVYSRSPAHLARAEAVFDVGNLYLNRPITGAVVGRQPFGGHRLSGLGTKAGGPDYLLHALLPKTICTNTTRHGMPLE